MSHLSNTDKSRILRAMKAAELSEEKQKHGAVIYKGGSLISVGINAIDNDPLFVGVDAINPKTHAEAMAIRACNPDVDLSNAIIYVARVNNNGDPVLSKPCATCQKAIEDAKIKRVVYTETEMKEWACG